MESRFGYDFSRVKVHTDDRAAESAKSVNALAYTLGNNVVFAKGQYDPRTNRGQRLLAHELAHVVQQSDLSPAGHLTVEVGNSSLEREARWATTRVAGGQAVSGLGRAMTSRIQRQEADTAPAGEVEEEPGFWGTVGGGLMGEFNENPNFAMIGVDVGVSLVPVLDQGSDVRDIIAHLYYLIFRRQYDRFMRWLGLVFTLIGLIPELGSAIKGSSKFIIRGVEVLIAHIADFIRPLMRLLPDAADLGRLQAFVARNWDRIVSQGMAAWNRTVERVSRYVALIPTFVSGRLRVLRELWGRIVAIAPARLAQAFAWIRRMWDSVIETVQRRLASGGAPPPRPAAPRVQQVYTEGELRTVTSTPEVVRGPRSGVRPEYSATPTPRRRPPQPEPPPRSAREEIGEVISQETAHPGRSLTDTAGHTADEAASLAEEVVSAGGRLDRLERHHSVFVFVLRAIQSRRAGRARRSVPGAGGEGFRQIVDDLFPQPLVTMDRMTHTALHRALNDILDEMLEPQRVLDLIARRGVVERGGAPAMMQRLQHITELELIDIVEETYRRVFTEHPGLLSDEMIEEALRAIERVRQAS